MTLVLYGIIAFAFIIIAYYTVFILREYVRGVVFFLGRFQSVMGPGFIVLIPGVQ